MTKSESPPEHPGTYVQREVFKDITVTEAAQKLKVGRPTLSRFLNAKSSLSTRMAQRLEREFSVDPARLRDLQARFDLEMGRDRAQTAPSIHTPPVLTIKAREVSRWSAGNIDARHELPVFVRRLVNSTSSSVTKVDFPAYDLGQRKGWDGVVEATAGTTWIPEGMSVWELSCEGRPHAKASDDYAKRVDSVDESERRRCTFVFVTPCEWPTKDEWAKTKRRLGHWKDVRAYDASTLEQWIECSAATQVWFAELLGHPVDGYRSLSRFWEDWASAADPPLSRAIFDSAVEEHSKTFSAWLNEEPTRPFTIAADSRDEAIAFLACLLDSVDDSQGEALDRGIVFDRRDALMRLARAEPGALLAVAGTADVEKSFAALHHPQHCVAPQHQNSVGLVRRDHDVKLQLLTPEDFKDALGEMDLDGAESDHYARVSARSPTILRRRLAKAPEDAKPPWANNDAALEWAVAPALVGAWHSASEADRQALELLSGTTYGDFESRFNKLRRLEDPPVWSVGAYHGVCSRIDALFTTAQLVRPTDLWKRFFSLAKRVLSESDPVAHPSGDSHRNATRNAKAMDHSQALREAVRETLILLAEHGDRLFSQDPERGFEQRVSQCVSRSVAAVDRGEAPLVQRGPSGLGGSRSRRVSETTRRRP